MPLNELAGKPAPKDRLIDVAKLEREYFERRPNPVDKHQLVSFGTSGHRGTPSNNTFTEWHILAITQAICEYRKSEGTTGPLFLGKDTHALSGVAQRTALEVLGANGVEVRIQERDGFTPTPAISRAILVQNRDRTEGLADGIVITPSHNPPEDGGFKYNPPDGGPAETSATNIIQDRANELLRGNNRHVRRMAGKAPTIHEQDYVRDYVEDLVNVIDMDAVREAGLEIGVDPLGGASLAYWAPIAERYGLKLKVVNPNIDPQFGFMTLDHDGTGGVEGQLRYRVGQRSGCGPARDCNALVRAAESESLSRGGDSVPAGAPAGLA
jgi:phosphoglucomutase